MVNGMHIVTQQADNQTPDGVISVLALSKKFERAGGEQVKAIDDVSLTVMPGEMVVLLGPSGCGKTTLLRCLAGLETPDQGEVRLQGEAVYSSFAKIDLPTEKRNASMLFQSYALWPHLSVFDNVAFPLRSGRIRGLTKAEIVSRVSEVLKIVNCQNLADQYPGEISGGQQQRVALARAIVCNEPVIYFDEPLSNIDSLLRDKLRVELRELQRRVGFSALYVTHDQQEALALADRIAILQSGRIAQIGTPREVYESPNSAYVARFMGNVNEVSAEVVGRDGGAFIIRSSFGEARIRTAPESVSVGDHVLAMCRPAMSVVSERRASSVLPGLSVGGVVLDQVFLGTRSEVIVKTESHTFVVWARVNDVFPRGVEVEFAMPAESIFLVPADSTAPAAVLDATP